MKLFWTGLGLLLLSLLLATSEVDGGREPGVGRLWLVDALLVTGAGLVVAGLVLRTLGPLPKAPVPRGRDHYADQ